MTKALTRYSEKEYDKFLNDKPLLELVDTLRCLDEDKPYVELSKNGEVGEFFGKKYKDLPIHNVKEFNSFYESLTNKLSELADSDERAQRYFEHRKYVGQLEGIPKVLSKLEKTVSELDILKEPFKAVMYYVWEAVTKHGFDMKEGFEGVSIKQRGIEVAISIEKPSEICLDVSKIYEKRKKSLFRRKKVKITQLNKLKINCFVESYSNWRSNCNPEEVIDFFKETISKTSYIKDFKVHIKTILELPKIMENYVKRKEKSVRDGLKEIGIIGG
ncbi:hypothetical protein KAT24_00190 [Candidatus Pacearchaeota archaeon]|nr:hypothetical protein [Candidatus Pacearchaeota archaeon]